MLRSLWQVTGGLLFFLLKLRSFVGISVEMVEIQRPEEEFASGEYEGTRSSNSLESSFTGVDPIDADCPAAGKCIGLLTRDGSRDSSSRYGCTEPPEPSSEDPDADRDTCGVYYAVPQLNGEDSTISSVRIALHPDSISKITVLVDGEVVVEEWDAAPSGQSEFQEIPGLEGLAGESITIDGVMEIGEYFAILEVEIYVEVDEVEIVGASASTRGSISAVATTDDSSAMNTLDGDASDASSWSCSSGQACILRYDLEAVESIEQLRIAFSQSTTAGSTFSVRAAGDSGSFDTLRQDIEAGGRPDGSDGLQTYGGVRAVASALIIEARPAVGGIVVINEVEFRVSSNPPARPVAVSKWLDPTGQLPLASALNAVVISEYDIRGAEDGGCDSPAHFDGCHPYYLKDGDMESRWSCGPLALGHEEFNFDRGCGLDFSLNYFRYVRQIQIAFDLGDEQHEEFSIEADTPQGVVTVVASAISSGDSTDYQTFDVRVFANTIRVVPKFQNVNQWFGIKEIIILELRKNEFIPGAGIVPVYFLQDDFDLDGGNDDENDSDVEVSTRFSFDIPRWNNFVLFRVPSSTVTAVRMKFPADREFVFNLQYSITSDRTEDVREKFTSAGGPKTWETFTLSEPGYANGVFEIFAVKGPDFARFPDYPALRVVDFEIVGEVLDDGPGHFNMVTTAMTTWGVIPHIVGDGVSEQEEIMTAICETKGATFDGTDCVGELDDSTVHINMEMGDFFLDGPVFVKSGVTLSGRTGPEQPFSTDFILYESSNNGNTAEDSVVVIDGVTDAEMDNIVITRDYDAAGEIVPGTIGNLDLDVRDSKGLRFTEITFGGGRTGSARFTDSSNITSLILRGGSSETGNYMDLTRVDDFHVLAFPVMHGLSMDTCTNIVWEGLDEFEIPTPGISPPAGSGQAASVVITGDSSNIVIKDCAIESGAEPWILMKSTMPLTLDNMEYDEAESGDCIVEVQPDTTEDLIVQLNSAQILSKSGNCWVVG